MQLECIFWYFFRYKGLCCGCDFEHIHATRCFSESDITLLEGASMGDFFFIGFVAMCAAISSTIKPLVPVYALTFHQFFEGMGLRSCISQTNFKRVEMWLLFASTPMDIGIVIEIINVYDENHPTVLIVERVFKAGILVYMTLVDFLPLISWIQGCNKVVDSL